MAEALLRALAQVLDGRTPNAARQSAQSVLDAFTDRAAAAREGMELFAMACRENMGDAERLFALSASERAVRTRWREISAQDQHDLSDAVLDALREAQSTTRGVGFLRSKLVSLIVELAKREWPQRWPDFMPKLEACAVLGTVQAEMALRVVRDLLVDCTNSDFNNALPPRRRGEILQGLRSSAEDLLALSVRFLQHAFTQLQQGGDERGRKEPLALAEATLGAVDALVEVTEVQSLLNHDIVRAVKAFAAPLPGAREPSELDVRVRSAAWGCIRSCAGKKTSDRGTTVDMLGFVCSLAQALRDGAAEDALLPPLRPLLGEQGSREAAWPCFGLGNDDDGDDSSAYVRATPAHTALALCASHLAVGCAQQIVEAADEGRPGSTERATDALGALLETLLRLLCHHSVGVRQQTMPGVQALLRVWRYGAGTAGAGHAMLHEQAPLLLRCLADACMQLGGPDSPASQLWPSSADAVEAFDDADAFSAGSDASRSQAVAALRELSRLAPAATMRFFACRVALAADCVADASRQQLVPPRTEGMRLCHTLQLQLPEEMFARQPAPAQPATPRQAFVASTLVSLPEAFSHTNASLAALCGTLSARGPDLAALAHVPARDLLLRAGADAAARDAQSLSAAADLRRALEALLHMSPEADPGNQALALQKFGACLGAMPDGPDLLLPAALNKLFAWCTFRDADLGAQTLARRRSAAALLDVCTYLCRSDEGAPSRCEPAQRALRARMASLLPSFCQQVLRTLGGSDVGPSETITLYEVLVVVSNALDDPAAQAAFVRDIVSNPLREWTSPAMSAAAASPTALASALRDAAPGSRAALTGARRSLSLLLAVARSSRGVAHGPRPFAEYWPAVLPNVLRMTAALHALGRDRAAHADVLCVHRDELRVLLGKGAGGGSGAGFSPSAGEDGSEHGCALRLAFHLRETLNSALGAAARYKGGGAFASAELLAEVPRAVFGDVGFIENRHLGRLVCAFVVPAVQCCPPHARAAFLLPLLRALLAHMLQRLQRQWPLVLARRSPGANMNLPPGRADPESARWDPLLDEVLLVADGAEPAPQEEPPAVCASRDCGRCVRCQQSEMAREAALRQLGSAFTELLSAALPTTPDDANAGDPRDSRATELSDAVMGDEQLSAGALLSLAACLASPDAAVVARAAQVLRRLLFACVLAAPRFHAFATGELFAACFDALFRPAAQLTPAASQNLLQLVAHLWLFAAHNNGRVGPESLPPENVAIVVDVGSPHRARIVRTLMARVPGLTPQLVEEAEAEMARCVTDKTRRVRVRDFVQMCIYELQPAHLAPAPGADTLDGKRSVEAAREVDDLPPQQSGEMSQASRRARREAEEEKMIAEATRWTEASSEWDMGVASLFQR